MPAELMQKLTNIVAAACLLLTLSCERGNGIKGIQAAIEKERSNFASNALEKIKVEPSIYGFGSLVTAAGISEKTLTVTNDDVHAIYISSISLEQGASQYTVSEDNCPKAPAPLAANSSCSVTVKFAPVSDGDFTAELVVAFTMPKNSAVFSVKSALSGTALSTESFGNVAIKFTPASHDFGAVSPEGESPKKAIAIRNNSAQDIYLHAVSSGNANFSVVSSDCPTSPTAFSPGQTCTATVTFVPQSGGSISMVLNVSYGLNVGEINLLALMPFSGTGVSPLSFDGIQSIDNITATSATIHWAEPDGANAYYIYRVSNGAKTLLGTVLSGTTSFALSGLEPGTSYTYRVNATDQLGFKDANSNDVTITTNSVGSFASLPNMALSEGASTLQALSCNDQYGSPATFTITSQSDADSNCSISGGNISCNPSYKTGHSNWSSAVSVQCSMNTLTYTRSFTVSVTDVNRAPSLSPIGNKTVTATLAVSAMDASDGGDDNDIDLDVLTYSCVFSGGGFGAGTNCTSLPGSAIFTASSGILSWTPSNIAAVGDAQTVYSISITASDQQSPSLIDAESFTITVNPAVVLTSVSDRNYANANSLLAGAAMPPIDINNASTGDDSNITYACTYDTAVDDAVSAGSACTSLPGSATFDSATGVLNWTPLTSTDGLFEIKVTGTHSSSSSDDEIFVLLVRPSYVTTDLLLDVDAKYGNGSDLGGSGSLWTDLSGNANDGALSGATIWDGTGSSNDPYRLNLAGSGYVDFSNFMSGLGSVMFDAWIRPSDVNAAGSVILSNASGVNGLRLRQSRNANGRLEFTIGDTSYEDLILSSNPVAYWRMNDSGAAMVDISGNGNHGTFTAIASKGIAGALTGDPDTAVSGNGTDEIAIISDSPSLSITGPEMTIEAWVYHSGTGIVLHKEGHYSLNIISSALTAAHSGNWNFGHTGNIGVISANTWHHVAFVKNASGYIFYIDGGTAAGGQKHTRYTAATATDLTDNSSSLFVGSYNGTASYVLNGKVDELAIYNYALTDADIAARFNARSRASCASASAFSSSEWLHVGGIFSESGATDTISLLVNGKQECSSSTASSTYTGSTNLAIGSTPSHANAWSGDIAGTRFYTSGTAANIRTNFIATADRFRATPLGNIMTSGLALLLDAANSMRGMKFGGTGCSHTSWFDVASGNTGTLTNFSSCGAASGWNGNGSTSEPYRLTFDGGAGNDRVALTSTDLGTVHTLGAWIKTTATGNEYIASGGGTSNYLSAQSDGKVYYRANGGVAVGVSYGNLRDGNWHHIAVARSGTSVKFYLDGVQIGTTQTLAANSNFTLDTLGNDSTAANDFTGSIAFFSVYSTELSQPDISRNCNAIESRFTASNDICN